MSESQCRPWHDAMTAATLLAVAPYALGGVLLRAGAGPVRDQWMKAFVAMLDPLAPVCKVPLHIADDRLLGGLDLPATLRGGRPVFGRGVLASADRGVLVLSMAERVSLASAARICQAFDRGEVILEREGFQSRATARFGVVALDEGSSEDEQPSAALTDRLAFRLDLSGISLADLRDAPLAVGDIAAARMLFDAVRIPEPMAYALCSTALAFGISSLRASFLACQVARAAAALGARREVSEADATLAARLVLAPRATCLPAMDELEPELGSEAPDDLEAGSAGDAADSVDPAPERDPVHELEQQDALEDVILAAARASIPANVLAGIDGAIATVRGKHRTREGRSPSSDADAMRGRPSGVMKGELKSGARLHLIETLRAAAPWQVLRRREPRPTGAAPRASRHIEVRREDFRVRRYRQRSQTTTIFVVDASGSAALHRLAEAKGAVELLLAECYIRRDQVAVVAFRRDSAELLLPPTRSLVRAKRGLASLPASGGTPLAAALDAVVTLADAVRRKGETPLVVMLSDGRANVARDGTRGREGAHRDAMQAASGLRAARVASLFVDTSPQPAGIAATSIAAQMGARYLALPYADASSLSRAVKGNLQ